MTLPPITDEDRQFLHYNPNTDDVVQWVRAYAQAAVLEEREACAEIAAPERTPYSDDEWRVRCEVRAAIRSMGE